MTLIIVQILLRFGLDRSHSKLDRPPLSVYPSISRSVHVCPHEYNYYRFYLFIYIFNKLFSHIIVYKVTFVQRYQHNTYARLYILKTLLQVPTRTYSAHKCLVQRSGFETPIYRTPFTTVDEANYENCLLTSEPLILAIWYFLLRLFVFFFFNNVLFLFFVKSCRTSWTQNTDKCIQ